MNRETHTVDVEGKPLGRAATEIATILMGKHKPDYARHRDMGDFVVVKNVDKIKLTGKKEEQKIYYRHSGYPGGSKKVPYEKVVARDSLEPLRKAVYGMLPKNKLRSRMIKRLKKE